MAPSAKDRYTDGEWDYLDQDICQFTVGKFIAERVTAEGKSLTDPGCRGPCNCVHRNVPAPTSDV